MMRTFLFIMALSVPTENSWATESFTQGSHRDDVTSPQRSSSSLGLLQNLYENRRKELSGKAMYEAQALQMT